MRHSQLIEEFMKVDSFSAFTSSRDPSSLFQLITQILPKLTSQKQTLDQLLQDQLYFRKTQKILQLHHELQSKVEELQKNSGLNGKNRPIRQQGVSKKTRAALARRHQKNQEEMRKDQIFVRLTPKSQNCIQFMLCNRNFPRMEVKLSCNQHLDYLINYLTNKWIRGKVGVKVVLYSDSAFLKSMPVAQRQKALKQPLNNYHMFTDIMACCGVQQNGVLNMTYQIVEVKKSTPSAKLLSPQLNKQISKVSKNNSHNQSLKLSSMSPSVSHRGKHSNANILDISSKQDEILPIKINSPVKYSYRDEFAPQASLFNRNSNNFFGEESMCSQGFNFGMFSIKKQDPLFSLNSNPYQDSYFPRSKESLPQLKQENHSLLGHLSQKSQENLDYMNELNGEERKQNSRQKENGASNREDPSRKLDNLMSLLQQIQKQKQPQQIPQLSQNQEANNSNRFKEVKTVSIVKKKTNNL